MVFLVISSSLLAVFITIICFSKTIQSEKIKKKQLNWISGKTKYLDEELEKSFYQRYIYPALHKFQTVSKKPRAGKKTSASNVRQENELKNAGLRMSAQEFMFMRLSLTVGILVAAISVTLILKVDTQILLLILLFAVALAVLIPRFFLKSRIKTRQTAMQHQLPNVMDVLCVCIEAGISFDSALLRVTEYFKGPLIEELSLVYREIQMGKPRREALASLNQRSNVEELKTFASAIVQSEQFGTPIKNVLRTQAQQLRTNRRQMAQEKGMKAPVKMTLPMVLFIFPVIFIILLGPVAIRFLNK